MDLCDLPIDLRHEIAAYLSYSSVANWALVSRRHYECINPVLYLKLPRHRRSERRGEKPSAESDPRFRGLVLTWAASRGRLNTIKSIVSSVGQGPWLNEPVFGCGYGGGLRTPNFYGMPPVHHAARGGHVDVIDLLVEYGADPDLTTAGDLRPIHYASNARVVHALVRHGCSIHATSPGGTPPLAYIVMSMTVSIGAIKQLLRLGCDPNAIAPWGNTAGQEAVRLGDSMVLKLLLKAGLRVTDTPSVEGALASPTMKQPPAGGSVNSYQLVKLLLENGAEAETKCWNPNLYSEAWPGTLLQRRPSELETPMTRVLLQASSVIDAGRDRLKTASLLLEYGAKLDQKYRDSTLLTKLFANKPSTNVPDVIIFMIEHGADVHTTHTQNQRNYQPIHLLSGPSCPLGPLAPGHRLFSVSGLQLLQSLLDHGANPNAPDGYGDVPLTYACRLPLDTIITSAGLGNLDLEARNIEGMTPLLSIAAMKLHMGRYLGTFFEAFTICERMMVMLLRNGADIHAKQTGNSDNSLTFGGTALHFACYNCNIAVLELLLDKGASKHVNTFTDTGFTPLMILVSGGLDKVMTGGEMEYMAQLLLDAGADPAVRNADGKTAWGIWTARCPKIYSWKVESAMNRLQIEDEKREEGQST
ncbi:ankyrin repeat-containing domain protein [Dactylonectria macrodidyma]|uniref:Ankyrin repeat-containing domain protein n=1 Tax=Dactylonectria macrodidyma TaxID=307937 RepID=A0A9P9IU76_9HYPO|nr:ankyrin repeat-containing domain protein [Dactylonectria macrodidyma]